LTVRRGPIFEQLALKGRVAGATELPISFTMPGRVESVVVKVGQHVEEGDLLAETQSKEIAKEVERASSRLQTTAIKIEQTRARQRENGRTLQNSVSVAEADLRRAQAELERVRAGAPVSERRSAEGAVAIARASFERAGAELERVQAGPNEAEVRAADQQVTSTRLALQRAEADLARLSQGADPTQVRTAERELAIAQGALDRARGEHARLSQGADPAQLKSAEQEVEIARVQLRSADANKPTSNSKDKNSKDSDKSARAAYEASVENANIRLRAAQDRLAFVSQGPPPWEVDAAQRNLESARLGAEAARERLDEVRKGPDPLVVSAAKAAVQQTQLDADNAMSRLADVQAGAPAERVSAARNEVVTARAALDSALARVADLNSRPSRAELADAQDRIGAADAAVRRAREQANLPALESDPAAFDELLLEKTAAEDRAQIELLEADLAATRLIAPSDGIVTAVQVRPGDPVSPDVPVLVLARPGPPVVRADLDSRDATRVLSGQRAQIQIEGRTDGPWDASVIGVENGASGNGSVVLQVSWGDWLAEMGAEVQAVVTLQEKADAVILPQRAIKSAGSRRYVETIEGADRRMVDVELGIVGAVDVEIVRGLREGQVVLVSS